MHHIFPIFFFFPDAHQIWFRIVWLQSRTILRHHKCGPDEIIMRTESQRTPHMVIAISNSAKNESWSMTEPGKLYLSILPRMWCKFRGANEIEKIKKRNNFQRGDKRINRQYIITIWEIDYYYYYVFVVQVDEELYFMKLFWKKRRKKLNSVQPMYREKKWYCLKVTQYISSKSE